jgi:hypothetical protein
MSARLRRVFPLSRMQIATARLFTLEFLVFDSENSCRVHNVLRLRLHTTLCEMDLLPLTGVLFA